jgi:hypothetical protein
MPRAQAEREQAEKIRPDEALDYFLAGMHSLIADSARDQAELTQRELQQALIREPNHF